MDAAEAEAFIKRLPSDLRKKIFCIFVNKPTQLYKISPYDFQQKELVRHVSTISKINKFLHTYTNSFLYVKNVLFQPLPYGIKYGLACCLILKSFEDRQSNSLKICQDKIGDDYSNACLRQLSGITRYFCASTLLCAYILNYIVSETKYLLEDGADPNFMINQGHSVDNYPFPLITLASDNSQESHEKLELLIHAGADINAEQWTGFGLVYGGCRRDCAVTDPRTSLAIAIAYDNPGAVKVLLTHKPHNLCAEKAFLSPNTEIKQLYLDYPLSQKDLDQALKGTLGKQNHDDIQQVLSKGANPNLYVSQTSVRTLKYISHPEGYHCHENYLGNSTVPYFNPGGMRNLGDGFKFLNIPIPNTEIMGLLCQAGAYDAENVEMLKKMRETIDNMINMQEKNKPQ